MAKSGNTWIKKLEHKAKQHTMKKLLGNENPVMNYCARAKPITARSLEREDIIDKPLPKKPPSMEEVRSGEAKLRPFIAPMVQGWKPRPYGKLNRRRLGLP